MGAPARVTVPNLSQVEWMDGFAEARSWVTEREYWQIVEPLHRN